MAFALHHVHSLRQSVCSDVSRNPEQLLSFFKWWENTLHQTSFQVEPPRSLKLKHGLPKAVHVKVQHLAPTRLLRALSFYGINFFAVLHVILHQDFGNSISLESTFSCCLLRYSCVELSENSNAGYLKVELNDLLDHYSTQIQNTNICPPLESSTFCMHGSRQYESS